MGSGGGWGRKWLFCYSCKRDLSKGSIILENHIFHKKSVFRREELSSFGCGFLVCFGFGRWCVCVCIKHPQTVSGWDFTG